jgi:ATP-dependent Clp protease protease subunit
VKLNVHIDSYIDKYGGFSLSQLKSMVESNPDTTEIVLRINSEGGSVVEGFAINNYLRSLNIPISCVIEGMCASIATVIALAAPKENRAMFSNASIMIHNPYWTPDAPIGMEADELESLASDLRKNEEQILNFYTQNLSLEAEVLAAKMKAETWIYSSEALEMGFVSTIINEKVQARKVGTIKAQINIENMKEFTQEQQSWLERKFSTIKALLKGNIKNMVVKLDDDREVFVFTEDGDLMGKRVVTVENGEPTETPAPNGEHATEDGRVIVVADGVITEVKEAADVEAAKKKEEELMNKVTALETQLAEMTAKLTEAETLKAAAETNIVNAQKEFDNFKAQLLTGKIEEFQDFSKGAAPQKTLTEKALEFRNKQKQK